MEINSLAEVLNVLSAFFSLFFAFYLLSLKSGNRSSNLLISFFLIISAIDSGSVISAQLILPYHPGLGLLLNTSIFLGPPLLYLYICSVTYQDFKLEWKHLWHTLPFVTAILLLIPRFYLADFDTKIDILRAERRFNCRIQDHLSFAPCSNHCIYNCILHCSSEIEKIAPGELFQWKCQLLQLADHFFNIDYN